MTKDQSSSAPFVSSGDGDFNAMPGSAKQIWPGSNPNQQRPRIIKRDCDIAAPVITSMGSSNYGYAKPRNQK